MEKTLHKSGIVGEYEFDSSWRDSLSDEYFSYREAFAKQLEQKPVGSGVGRTPVSLEVETTYHCNLQCPFCARGVAPGYKELKHMDQRVWKKLVEDIKGGDTKALMMDHEGESLLNPRLCSMISEAREAGVVDVWLHTNGNLLSEQRGRDLIESGLTRLNVSIDATTEETYSKVRPGGTLEKVESNLREFLNLRNKMNRRDIRVRVSFVYHDRNAHEREAFIQRWKDDVNVVAIQSMIDLDCFNDPARFLSDRALTESQKEYLRSFTCEQIWTVPILDTDGNLIACGMPVRQETADDLIIGNIMDSSLAELWNSDKLDRLRKKHKNHVLDNPTCKACAVSLANSSYVQASL